MTVSNVLNGREGRVSPAIRSRVWEAVEELGYVPVASPISQKQRQPTRTIGVVFDSFNPDDRGLGTAVFSGMMEAARDQDYDLLSILRSPRQWNGTQAEVALFDGRADCFIFLSSFEGSREATLSDLVAHGMPCVAAFRRDVPEGVATVDGDHEGAMELCIQHLVQLGHERIAFIGGDPARNAGHRREEGFRHSMQSRGLLQSDEWISIVGDFVPSDDEATNLAHHLISLKATAAVCASDWLATKLWDALQAQGVRVPEDISLTGVDNLPMAQARNLTTISIPGREIGRLCVQICDQLTQDVTTPVLHHVLPVQLEVRSSTAPPAD
ncbi:LacI family transcriptional regulator [bacterium]|nr:MAG: LacI family transcriptional regulator [bacterium]